MKDFSKIPPQNIQTEELILGAFIIEPKLISEYIDLLPEGVFYKDAHNIIYRNIREMYVNADKIDLATIVSKLMSDKSIDKVGGVYYLSQLTGKIASTENMDSYVKIILEHHARRELIAQCSDTMDNAFDESYDIFDTIHEISGKIDGLSSIIAKRDVVDMQTSITEAVHEIFEKRNKGIPGIPCGFPEIDKMTGGWHNSDLIILAARPGMGKTSLAVSMVYNIIQNENHNAVFFSLEMSNKQLMNKLISYETGIPLYKFVKNTIDDNDVNIINSKIGSLSNKNLSICDTPALSLLDIKAKSRRLKEQGKCNIIFIDYLQLISGDSKTQRRSRENEVSSISAGLKGLAKELDVPVIALSQLSRDVEKRSGSKKPKLKDLRESGAIEQDADVVTFIYRPDYYEDEETDNSGYTEFLIEKHRHGALGMSRILFKADQTRFIPEETEYFIPESLNHNPNYYESEREATTPF